MVSLSQLVSTVSDRLFALVANDYRCFRFLTSWPPDPRMRYVLLKGGVANEQLNLTCEYCHGSCGTIIAVATNYDDGFTGIFCSSDCLEEARESVREQREREEAEHPTNNWRDYCDAVEGQSDTPFWAMNSVGLPD